MYSIFMGGSMDLRVVVGFHRDFCHLLGLDDGIGFIQHYPRSLLYFAANEQL
jgi:hypothetical protein